MPTQIQGNSNTVVEVDGTSFRSLRVTSRPVDYSVSSGNGHYSAAAYSGVIAAGLAASSEIFQFRWTSSSLLAVINRIRISASMFTTYFSAGVPLQFALYKSTSWSASGTGGTSVSLGATCKTRTSMASSSVGDFRQALTAALGAGTKTLDANAFAVIAAQGPTSGCLIPCIIPAGTSMFEPNVANGAHPLVLAQNEGFSLIANAVPATGTWQFTLEVQWAEVAQY